VRGVTAAGLRQLRCHLMIMREHLDEVTKTKLLGLLRDLSLNNAPMILGLRTLFERMTLSVCNKIAIEEGLYVVFALMLTQQPPSNLDITNVFEFSRFCLAKLVQFVKTLNVAPKIWKDREVFSKLDCFC
jgi:hypothetical protein